MNKQKIRLLLEQAEIESFTEADVQLESSKFLDLNLELEEEQEEGKSEAFAIWQFKQGCLYFDMGDYIEAALMFEKSIGTYKREYEYYGVEISQNIFVAFVNWAYCCCNLNDTRGAIKILLGAMEIMKMMREEDYSNAYWRQELDLYIELGRLYVDLDKKEMALFYYERAVECLNSRGEEDALRYQLSWYSDN